MSTTESLTAKTSTLVVSWLHFAAVLAGVLFGIAVAIGTPLIIMYSKQQSMEQQLQQANLPEISKHLERMETDVAWLRRNAENRDSRDNKKGQP